MTRRRPSRVPRVKTRVTRWKIRPAAPEDLPDLVRVYNHYVIHSHVTFDVEPFDVEDRRAWFERFSESGPFRLLVAEGDADLVGYASSTEFK